MPKIHLHDSDAGLEFETFEASSKKWLIPKPKTRRSRRGAETAVTILGARRLLERPKDGSVAEARIARILKPVISSESPMVETKRPEVSLLTTNEARFIFRRYYFAGQGIRSSKKFRRIVSETIRAINEERPAIDAKLGEISVFGARQEDPTGKRLSFVGPTIIGDGAKEFIEDKRTLLHALMPDSSDFAEDLVDKYIPHLSLVRTNSFACADSIVQDLSGAGITGTTISLLTVTPTDNAFNQE